MYGFCPSIWSLYIHLGFAPPYMGFVHPFGFCQFIRVLCVSVGVHFNLWVLSIHLESVCPFGSFRFYRSVHQCLSSAHLFGLCLSIWALSIHICGLSIDVWVQFFHLGSVTPCRGSVLHIWVLSIHWEFVHPFGFCPPYISSVHPCFILFIHLGPVHSYMGSVQQFMGSVKRNLTEICVY